MGRKGKKDDFHTSTLTPMVRKPRYPAASLIPSIDTPLRVIWQWRRNISAEYSLP